MSKIVVIGRRATAYGPARQPVEVEDTPRVKELIKLGVLYRPAAEVKPVKKAASTKQQAETPAPVTGVTSAPEGTDAVVSAPIDHEGAPDE